MTILEFDFLQALAATYSQLSWVFRACISWALWFEPVCVTNAVPFLIVWNSALARAFPGPGFGKTMDIDRAQDVMLVEQVVIYVVQSQYRNVFKIIY